MYRKKLWHFFLTFSLISVMVSCQDAKKLKGGIASGASPREADADPVEPTPTPDSKTPPAATPDPISSSEEAPIPVTPKVPEVKDGLEVVRECDACFARAVELAESIDFVAKKELSTNMGPYKIDAGLALCDYHFKKKFLDPIQDHEGKAASILKEQIALYCPCKCGVIGFPIK